MAKGYVRPATQDDVNLLAPNLRQADILECKLNAGLEPGDALQMGLDLSAEVHSIMSAAGKPLGMFGVGRTVMKGVGCVWMLASDRLIDYKWQFLRDSRKWVDHLHTDWPVLWNYVYAKNELHLKWLRWLGFELLKLHPRYGAGQAPFFEFVRKT